MTKVGSRLGSYTLLEELGVGSLASVFRARDVAGTTYSVKVLHPFMTANPKLLERFRRESRVLAELAHPGIVPFRGHYEASGQVFYVMDFVPFPTVEVLVQDLVTVPVTLALRITAQVAETLAFAHSRQVVHRDLKPANLFHEARTGRTLLADFGLSKAMDEEPITSAGSRMMGTPYFMAPEQVSGDAIGFATDIYQLGLVLFHLVTGKLPFDGPDRFKVVARRCEEELCFDAFDRSRLAPEVIDLVLRAAARDPGSRIQDVATLGAEAEALCRSLAG